MQRVTSASVSVSGQQVSAIGPGLVCLVGLRQGDGNDELRLLSRKLLNMKLFENAAGQSWKQSVMNKSFAVLCVSQFTLYGKVKASSPDFGRAMSSAEVRLQSLLSALCSSSCHVHSATAIRVLRDECC